MEAYKSQNPISEIPLSEAPLKEVRLANIDPNTAEAKTNEVPRVREYQPSDLDSMVELDMASFKKVYSEYDQTEDEMRQELKSQFAARIEKTGGEWVQILEDESSGKLLGFLMSCPTSKKPEDFESWEDTTDRGTLETTFDPEGENIYVVSLTMASNTFGKGYPDMLYANLAAKGIKMGYSRAFFEARLPGLKRWVKRQCDEKNIAFDDLSKEQKDAFAEEYFNLKRVDKKGNEVPYDPLIRSFSKLGCKFEKVIPDAYKDEPSMNYGVVTTFENPLPDRLKSNKPVRHVAASAIKFSSQPNKLRNIWDKSKTKLALGAFATSIALTLTADPFAETKHRVLDAAPWVGGGLVAGEVLWLGGAALMLSAVGEKIKNPLKIKKNINDIATKANSSRLFKTGFYANTVGAVGEFGVLGTGVISKLPVHSWGIMGLALLDLGVTIHVRKTIKNKIEEHSS